MVIINGGGIAGLTLANALQQKKHPYVILEKAEKLEAIGAGIALQNNGLAILQHLGLTHLLGDSPLQHMQLGPHNQLRSFPLSETELECRIIHRGQLQQMLLSKLSEAHLRLGTTLSSAHQDRDGVHVTLNDGTELTADVLVNAAGIHSDLHSAPVLRDSGLWCWRTVVNLKHPLHTCTEIWFGHQRFGLAPIDTQRAYLFHVIKLKKGQRPEDWTTEQREHWIRQQHTTLPDIQALDFKAEPWLSNPLKDRSIHWGDGRLVAIGDAAHAMTPNLGQGAVLSMEDAIELATLIHQNEPKPAAAIAQRRHQRVARMHRMSWWFGNVAHAHHPVAMQLKKALFGLAPIRKSFNAQVAWMNAFNQTLQEHAL